MKKIRLLALILSIGASGLYGCSQPEQSPKPQDVLAEHYKVPAVLYGATVGDLRIPDGTETIVEDEGATVRLKYPAGIRFINSQQHSLDFASKLDDGGGGSYTCTGACSVGCDVFYVQSSFACSQCSNGSACTGKASRSSETGGFVDTGAGISFIRTKEQLQKLEKQHLQVPDDLFHFEYVNRAMRKLNVEVHGEADPTQAIARNPDAYKHVAINMYGAVVDYTVPINYLNSEAQRLSLEGKSYNRLGSTLSPTQVFLLEESGGGFSCACSSGGSGCTAESGIGYKKCNSGACTSCTMSVQ
ncbi:hypothetical protein [Hymenobacter sp.]|jgi:hypothetical protein|uniref:hypothetical protein n=1 Tax=Hymenobacter sp. TaxID=1898978 RepID=UPI002ED8AC0B